MIPHFSFPFRFGGDGAAVVLEQNDFDEIEQNVKILLQTEAGERIEVPDFGIDDPTFEVDIDSERIAAIAEEWDDRVDVLIADQPDRIEQMVRNMFIQVEER